MPTIDDIQTREVVRASLHAMRKTLERQQKVAEWQALSEQVRRSGPLPPAMAQKHDDLEAALWPQNGSTRVEVGDLVQYAEQITEGLGHVDDDKVFDRALEAADLLSDKLLSRVKR